MSEERLMTRWDLLTPPMRPLCDRCGVRGCTARHRRARAAWWRRGR
jgi:hypothetical protein